MNLRCSVCAAGGVSPLWYTPDVAIARIGVSCSSCVLYLVYHIMFSPPVVAKYNLIARLALYCTVPCWSFTVCGFPRCMSNGSPGNTLVILSSYVM